MRLTRLVAGFFIMAFATYLGLDPASSAKENTWSASLRSALHAQAAPQSQQPLQVRTTLVNVFATVRGKGHEIVSDLAQTDFKVFEDSQEQKISFFSKEVNMPITLGLLIDTSGSMERVIGAEQDTAPVFCAK